MNNIFSAGGPYSRNFIVRAESVYGQLKSAEKSALDTILSMVDFNVKTTVSEVADLSGSSGATITRLARRLGYAGFPEMKESMFSTEASSGSDKNYFGKDTLQENVSDFFNIARNTLIDTEKMLYMDDLQRASDLIKNATKILFVGSGDAQLIAHSGFYKFYKAGYDALCSDDFDETLVHTSKLKENDVIIAISYSGISRTVLEIIKLAKANNVKVITITAYPLSKIAKMSDIVFLTPAFSDIYNEVVSKRIPAMALLEVLYVISTNGNDEKVQNVIENANQYLKVNKLDNLPDRLW